MQTDASYRQRVKEGESSIRLYLQQHPRLGQPSRITVDNIGAPTPLGGSYTIPVVVHIVHTGGAIGTIYNPTDAQIQGAIDYLNAVYNGTYPTLSGGVGDLGIQFVLAKRDPNCNPTTGIDRIDGSSLANYVSGGVRTSSSLPGTDDINVKNLVRWDPTQYYNVWVVDKINGADGTAGQFIAGFAYFPGASPSLDGIVMLATQMVTGQKTLPHEIGHAFGLYHPFEGSTDVSICPANSNCSLDGDQVCDTDPISENVNSVTGVVDFTCRTGTNTCTGSRYTDSTEHNYMNYTNCYTLFTAGQKARMLAAAAGVYRAGLTTSLGGTAPNAGSSPCVPKINFESSADQAMETTAATSGCRSYKDYTYNMVIGNTPTATATVTLTVSGAAQQGLDYDITTNGSFTSPSQVLTFPSGSMTSRSFTVRIYDDASVNGARSFTLGFTVNSGGGNAVAGNGIPSFTFTIKDNDSAPVGGTSNGKITVGNAASQIPDAPFDGTATSQRAQFLYKASELTAAGVPAGQLTGLSLQIMAKHSVRAFTNLNIKMGTSGVSYLINGSTITVGSGLTVVKTLSSYNTVAGWNDFTFDTPFTWDGVSNLVVELCYDNGSAAAGDGMDQVYYYGDGGSSTQYNMFWQNNINCSQSFSSLNAYSLGIKPMAKFWYGIVPTTVQTVLNSSMQQYLGPNADVYFYDQTNHQLMARIQNLSNFDYGCTQVVIDRQGTGSSQFWNNNTTNYLMNKTFRVLPANNNASGSYNITLYYTQAEINGWTAATTQSLSNIQLVKVAGQISSVTPAAPTGAGAVVIGSPTISTLGTNTALTYNFTTGFSGFGAGVPDVALPLSLLSFDGQLRQQHAALQWTTAFESNTKRFGVERSYDGISYSNIGYVNAAGNSSTQQQYAFTDTALARLKNYYRLNEIDIDGRSTYSKVIMIGNTNRGPSFTVSPIPFTTSLDLVFGRPLEDKTSIRLLDMTGKALFRQENTPAGQDHIHLDLSGLNLAAGLYLLEVRTSNQVYVEKLIRQ
ncbi:MAG TPA: M43 family zinc metalloprotease [Puia sp.]|nr:M43 family zinc metalloprotease [Puia sp.]